MRWVSVAFSFFVKTGALFNGTFSLGLYSGPVNSFVTGLNMKTARTRTFSLFLYYFSQVTGYLSKSSDHTLLHVIQLLQAPLIVRSILQHLQNLLLIHQISFVVQPFLFCY